MPQFSLSALKDKYLFFIFRHGLLALVRNLDRVQKVNHQSQSKCTTTGWCHHRRIWYHNERFKLRFRD